VRRLGFVAAGRHRRERATADQPHAVLRVADFSSGHELKEPARRAVCGSPVRGHALEVAEAIADDELCAARRGEEGGNRLRGVLAVGIDHEHRVGVAGACVVDARANGRPLAAASR
jgi:hypothetical protein